MKDELGLEPHQRDVAGRVLAEEASAREHLVVALSGAHAYGFPSPDSDLDLKAVHVEATPRLLGLRTPRPTAERMEVIEGVEIDYSSNEIQPVVNGILAGNGNFAERILGARLLIRGPDLEGLTPLVQAALSRRMHRHYHGFATSQLRELDQGAVTAKRVLYVLRTALTGAHLLATGRLIADLSLLADDYGFANAHALIDQKRAGERIALDAAATKHWRGEVVRAFEELDRALEKSPLPVEAPNGAALEAWLLAVRRARW